MTKPTGRPRGRPRKNPLPEESSPQTTAAGATAPAEENEERVIEERIADLEAERAALEGPPPPLTAVEIAQGVALVDEHEQRRSTIERLLAAYRIKRLQIRRARYERELEPFVAARQEAGERLEALEAQRIALVEEIGKVRASWSDANVRADSKEQHIRYIDREIRELRGE